MSIKEKILELLLEPKFRYKGIPVNAFGFPAFREYKKKTFQNGISRLKREGYIATGEDKVRITNRGQEYIKKKIDSFKNFDPIFAKDAPKNLLVMYDIPEERKSEREWFRFHLRKFGYIMIQKSVWAGPSPLPKEFVAYLKKIDLMDRLKTFKLAKDYVNTKQISISGS